MKITRLELRSSPGLRRGFRLDEVGPGLNVIVGPNGSGKTSLVRAMRSLLWDEEPFRGEVSASWEHGGGSFEATRETGLAAQWVPTSSGATRPELPDARFRRCFTLSVDDFLVDESTREEIAGEIRKELSAGFDLRQVLERERALTPQGARSRATALREAKQSVQQVQDEHRALLVEERELEELEGRRDLAHEARGRSGLLEDAIRLAEARALFAAETRALEEFPEGMEGLRGNEAQRLQELREQLTAELGALAEARQEVEDASEEIAAADLARPIAPERLEVFTEREARLRECEHRLEEATHDEAVAATALGALQRALFVLTRGEAPAQVGRGRWDLLEEHLRERDRARVKLDEARARLELGDDSVDEAAEPAGGDKLSWEWIAAALVVVGLLGGLFLHGLAWALLGAGVAIFALRWERGEGRAEQFFRSRQAEERRRAHKAAERSVKELEQSLRDYCEENGLSGELSTLSLTEISELSRKRDEAKVDFAALQGARQEASACRARELAAINVALEEFGVPPVRDAVELRRAKDELARRDTSLRHATDRMHAATARAESADQGLTRAQEALGRFFVETGLAEEDVHELELRLEQLSRYGHHRDAARVAQREVQTYEQRLSDHPDLLELDLAEARAQLAGLEAATLEEGSVTEEIARIREQVRRAREGHDLEQALHAEQQAHEALAEVRDELFEGAAAEFLLDSVQEEHRQHAQPDILRRASAWFGRFTSHAYELTPPLVSDDESAGFTVREAEGGTKLVGELSSGTLSQLQLALRLAVAQSLEKDAELPLVLDEALTNSDPVRFREVARSLGALAADGRQVFFLTADPDDALRLEEALAELQVAPPRRFDLAELRGEAAAMPSLEHAPLPTIPAPEPGEAAAAYGERLRVPALDPFLGVDAMHLLYALGHDLEGLHALLLERVETVGQARQLLAARAGQPLDSTQRERFDATRALVAGWFEAFKIGRGQRLTSADLREGPLSSTKYLEDVVAINEELAGDARALLNELGRDAATRDARLKGFRSAKIEALAADLEERGCYSPEEPLRPAALRDRALAAGETWLARGTLSREDAFQLTHALGEWLELS